MNDLISRQAAIDRINKQREHLQPDIYPQDMIGDAAYRICAEFIERLPSVEPEIAENLYLCKCYITDKDGLQHEVIHTGDIRRVTGWEI